MMRTIGKFGICILGVIVGLGIALRGSLGDDAPPATQASAVKHAVETSPTVVQTYDISDIVALRTCNERVQVLNDDQSHGIIIPGGSFSTGEIFLDVGTGTGGVFGGQGSKDARVIDIELYVTNIVDAIASATGTEIWPAVDSHIHRCGTLLVITLPSAKHKIIEKLLNDIREQLGTQIALDMRILKTDQAAFDALTKDSGIFLTPERLDALMKTARQSGQVTTFGAPRLILMNGGYCRDKPVAKSGLCNFCHLHPGLHCAWLPNVSMVTTGWSINAKATAMADRKHVVVQLEPSLAVLRKFALAALPEKLKDMANTLDVYSPIIDVSALGSALTIPNGQYAVLGGQKLQSAKPADAKAKATGDKEPPQDEQYLVILVRPTIIETSVANPPK